MRRFALFVALAAALVASFGCEGGNPNAPPPITAPPPVVQPPAPPPGPVLAPPPEGVSPGTWQAGFFTDNRLRRPEGIVHLDVSGLPQEAQVRIAEVAAWATRVMTLPSGEVVQGWDTNHAAGGVVYTVSVVAGPLCEGRVTSGGCTYPQWDLSGRITGGIVQVTSLLVILQDRPAVLHELFRTAGVMRNASGVSIMAANTSQFPPGGEPTAEDIAMLLGRYEPPLLAVYTAQ